MEISERQPKSDISIFCVSNTGLTSKDISKITVSLVCKKAQERKSLAQESKALLTKNPQLA